MQEKTVTPPEAAAPVEDTYFSDTVFVGDSRTEGFHLYSGLKEGQYLYSVGATVSSIFTKATEQTAAGKVPIMDALTGMECSKVYVMLGVNELGYFDDQGFYDNYCKAIDEIRKLQDLKRRLAAELKSNLQIAVDIKIVEPKTIERSEGKAKRIIDLREGKKA